MDQNIINLLIALIPSITGVLALVGSAVACITKVKGMTDNHANDLVELQKKLKDSVNQNIQLSVQNESIKKALDEEQENLVKEVARQRDCFMQIVETNKELIAQNEELKKQNQELVKIKQQLTELLKKEK